MTRWRPADARPSPWYGATLAWWAPFERDAKRRHPEEITTIIGHRQLTYRTRLEVPGRVEPIPVSVSFFADPPYDTYGLPAEDYPRVWADRGRASPHRMPGGSLCLYSPFDPAGRRWRAELGLRCLLNLTRDHLFFEHNWRTNHIWLGPEAPHGLPRRRAA